MKLILRAFNISDAENVYNWMLDPQIQELISTGTYFASKDYVKKWIEDKIFSKSDIYLAVCDKDNEIIIGYLSINNIDFRNRKAEWGGMIIGDKNYWGKGVGTEAARLMLKFVFEELNINLFWAFWIEENYASIKIGEKIGFKKIGLLPQSIYKNNKYHNQLIMYMLKDDYLNIEKN
jgi:RimJ/RimL family protein N-acetyltransferase